MSKVRYRNLSVSLPERMIEVVDRAAEREQRTRSELVREALRFYLQEIPAEAATPEEIAAMDRGRAEIERGEYVTLDQLLHELAPHRRPLGKKKPR